jgi:putative FmdB family regulatory protein
MPLYEYQCDACGHRLEIIQKFSDGPPDTCPKCGKGPLQRLQSSPAIQFKGTGWYVTDYAGKGKDSGTDKGGESKPAEGKKSDAGGSSGESGGGTESKKGDPPASAPAAAPASAPASAPAKKD